MDILTIDYESYWSKTYSLSKMSPLEYIKGPEFEVISCSLKLNDYPTDVVFGQDEVGYALRRLDFSKRAALAHNMTGFDAYILAYVYGIHPKLWLDTAAMARPKFAKTVGVSLAKLVEHFAPQLRARGISGVKNNAVLMNTQGRHLCDFTKQEIAQMEVYNKDDTEQCKGIFDIMRPDFNASELWQIDALVRCRTEPGFEVDVPMLETAASVERSRKHAALLNLARKLNIQGVDWEDTGAVVEHVRSEMASSAKFAALLTELGEPIPLKPSPTVPGANVPALAKSDEAFIALTEHEDDLIATAARCRLEVKSTLVETRIAKVLTAAEYAGGMLPIPLRYCGADTTGRDSGEEYNPQNFPAIRGEVRPAHALRNCMKAPKGYVVGVADQSGIELRVNHFLWKVPSTMELYRGNPEADLYRAQAALAYGCTPDEVSKPQRHVEKIKQLGLGFGAGARTFVQVARTMGGLKITEAESQGYVDDWRRRHKEIVQGWRTCHDMLPAIRAGHEMAVDPWGLVWTCAEGLRLPSGRIIRYPDLRQETAEGPNGEVRTEWVYGHGRHKARIYAGKIDENIVQALARDSIFDCALDFFKLTRLRFKLRVHDELVYLFPQSEAEALLAELQRIMRTPPKWWPDLVVWSEGDIAVSYGAAK